MSESEIPDTGELYEQATRIEGIHEDAHESGGWGEEPYQEDLSNFFVWDLQPERFNYEVNTPDELVVLPNVYEEFRKGTGFSLTTPLNDEEDLRDAREVLGEDMVHDFGSDSYGVREVDTPQDIVEMHYIADSLDIDVFHPQGFQDYFNGVDEAQAIDEEWVETADTGYQSLVDEYARPATGRFLPELTDEFSDNDRNTAFVFYANESGGNLSEDPIYMINRNNEGGMAYHTPFTLNQVLKQSML